MFGDFEIEIFSFHGFFSEPIQNEENLVTTPSLEFERGEVTGYTQFLALLDDTAGYCHRVPETLIIRGDIVELK